MTSRVFPKGTEITCPNGHLICKPLADIVHGQIMNSDDFEWFVEKPQFQALAHCPKCGECYWLDGLGSRIHTKDGWFYSREGADW